MVAEEIKRNNKAKALQASKEKQSWKRKKQKLRREGVELDADEWAKVKMVMFQPSEESEGSDSE